MVIRSNTKEHKKTATATLCRSPTNNSVNEQNNETARAKYNLVGFSAVLCKTTTSNEHFPSFVANAWLSDVELSLENSEVNNNGKSQTVL